MEPAGHKFQYFHIGVDYSFIFGLHIHVRRIQKWSAFMKENLIYTAGLMDGEGTVTLLRGRKSDKFKHPVISITSTSIELIQFLKETYGGVISNQKTYKKHHKPSWSWKLSFDPALQFISSVRPYMKEKSKCYRMDLILANYKNLTKRNGKYTPDEIEAKLNFETTFFHPSDS